MSNTLIHSLLKSIEEDKTLSFYKGPQKYEKFSYPQIAYEALTFSQTLQSLGVQKNQPVAIVLPTGPHFLVSFFAIQLAGGIPVALYPPTRLGKWDEWKTRTSSMLTSIQAVGVITDQTLYPFLGSVLAPLSFVQFCFPWKDTLSPLSLPPQQIHTMVSCLTKNEITEEDTAFIQFSSGSTGNPKPIFISHRNVLANIHMIITGLNVKKYVGEIFSKDHPFKAVSWLPLYHDMGLVGAWLTSLEFPNSEILLIRPEQFLAKPSLWPQAIDHFKAHLSVAPNFAYSLVAKKMTTAEKSSLDLSGWKYALRGAEMVHQKTVTDFTQQFAAQGFQKDSFLPVYGLAEATLAVTFPERGKDPLFLSFRKKDLEQNLAVLSQTEHAEENIVLANLGRTLEGVRLEIRHPQTRKPLKANSVGQVWVQSPSVSLSAAEEGWLNTGDLGFLHDENLFLVGRSKDIIIYRGRNFDPTRIEQDLLHFDFIRPGQVIAFGYHSDQGDTEELILLVELKSAFYQDYDSHDQEAQMQSFRQSIAKKILEQHQIPCAQIIFLEPGTLPKTSSGKLKRQTAKEMWIEKKLKAPKALSKWHLLKEWIVGFFFIKSKF